MVKPKQFVKALPNIKPKGSARIWRPSRKQTNPPPAPKIPATAMPRHPFQKLCPIPRSTSLLAAAGSKLYAIGAPSGRVSWKLHEALAKTQTDHQEGNGQEQPSAKRRKLEDGTANGQQAIESRRSSEDSINFKTERAKGERKKPKVETEAPPPNISHLLATKDGKHVVVVTAEDKAITVYELSASGIVLKSTRNMPKRLCAATLTPDERFLVVGDKFGDVYELPLHPTEGWTAPEKKAEKYFEPSATELTVHTKGNLQALKQQKEQKKKAAEKDGLNFEHRVLLGHVSLLTEVQVAQNGADGRQRTYVLTADRDEHVRVSRYPQAHIIEGYCLGIREFVSRLCVLPWATHLVAVGTGEPSVRIYEWLSERLLSMDGFQDVVERLTGAISSNDDRDVQKLAVIGIWPVTAIKTAGEPNNGGRLLVALEGVPLLLSYAIDSDGKLVLEQTLQLNGNALDVAVLADQQTIIVSSDTAHLPGSTMTQQPPAESSSRQLVQAFKLQTSASSASWEPTDLLSELTGDAEQLSDLPEVPSTAAEQSKGRSDRKSIYSPLGNFLYGLENLRKKRDYTGLNAEDEDGEESLVGSEVPPTT